VSNGTLVRTSTSSTPSATDTNVSTESERTRNANASTHHIRPTRDVSTPQKKYRTGSPVVAASGRGGDAWTPLTYNHAHKASAQTLRRPVSGRTLLSYRMCLKTRWHVPWPSLCLNVAPSFVHCMDMASTPPLAALHAGGVAGKSHWIDVRDVVR
jgi:hypothetical protein